ncbi:MAG: DUF4956 domain-containing protein [Lewinellaceae bacterium]|nr:DUF4956 domain-containing protein [Lewinellaceae bacterium]
MNQNQTFEQFLANQVPEISPWNFLINLLLTALLAHLLGRVYSRFGTSLSNKKMFAANFELIAVTTMIIITIVKSSLALSLGLVGALSIVRFRAAIKEPQELAYIFLTIALGLGFGADQRIVTSIGFFFVVAVIWGKYYLKPSEAQRSLNFTVMAENAVGVTLDRIVETIMPHCKELEMKRLDENKNYMEAAFVAEFNNFNDLNKARSALHGLDDSIQISFLDQNGII